LADVRRSVSARFCPFLPVSARVKGVGAVGTVDVIRVIVPIRIVPFS
jgi:hypothetical protein